MKIRTDVLNALAVGLFAWLARVSKGKQTFKGDKPKGDKKP